MDISNDNLLNTNIISNLYMLYQNIILKFLVFIWHKYCQPLYYLFVYVDLGRI